MSWYRTIIITSGYHDDTMYFEIHGPVPPNFRKIPEAWVKRNDLLEYWPEDESKRTKQQAPEEGIKVLDSLGYDRWY